MSSRSSSYRYITIYLIEGDSCSELKTYNIKDTFSILDLKQKILDDGFISQVLLGKGIKKKEDFSLSSGDEESLGLSEKTSNFYIRVKI